MKSAWVLATFYCSQIQEKAIIFDNFSLENLPFTRQSLTAMLERLGVNVRGQTLRTGNVAAVM